MKGTIQRLFTKPIFIWFIASLFYFYENLLQASQSVILPELMRDFNLTAHSLSTKLGASFLIAYSISQFIIGILLDKYSTKVLLTIAISICAIATYAYANTQNIDYAMASRIFIGIGAAFAALSSLKVSANWFEHKRFALLTGLLLSIGMLGALGEAPLLYNVTKYGWRVSFEYISYLGIILAVITFAFIKDNPQKQLLNTQKTFRTIFGEIKKIIMDTQVWAVALYGMLMFTPFLILSNLWGPTILNKFYNLSRETSANIFGLIFIGFIIGAPLFGWFSDYLNKRKLPLFISTIGSGVTILLVIYNPIQNIIYLSSLIFLLGFFTSGFLPSFSIMKEVSRPNITTTSLGFMNTLNMLGGAIFMHFSGIILDLLWQNSFENGIRVYSISNYQTAFAILPILYAIALVLLCTIKETHCKCQHIKD
jgi:sugar phosphate permease